MADTEIGSYVRLAALPLKKLQCCPHTFTHSWLPFVNNTQNLEDIDVHDSTVINCLQDFSTEIKSEMCKEQVCGPRCRGREASQGEMEGEAVAVVRATVALEAALVRGATRQEVEVQVKRYDRSLASAHRHARASACALLRQVRKYVSLAAQDIRFDVPLAEACYEDRQKYCARVPPVSAGTKAGQAHGIGADQQFGAEKGLCSASNGTLISNPMCS